MMIAHYREQRMRKALTEKVVQDVMDSESKKSSSKPDASSPITRFLGL